MSVHGLFSDSELKAMQQIAGRYEEPASAILPLLHFVQEARGHLGENELVYVADFLQVPHVRAYEVATYYTMFTIKPRGRHVIQVCRNLSCTMGGAEQILERLTGELGVGVGETTADGLFSIVEVECIGACDLAPAIMIDEELHGRVAPETLPEILGAYRVKK
ncbi:MAG: NADH-quinone oxidoreductase subunit NuoE [bacterium]|nr:MAG: NADH-quinone oxidoreductase subunit NuoE [bacterium]